MFNIKYRSTTEEDAAKGHRGTLVFTGATAAMRGGDGFAAFAAGKFGIRAITQSIAREYGREGIHVAHGEYQRTLILVGSY
jgi:NAD(P)-dependent dehydrogenase (short-subunit alcohol dehydrogenase family)